MRSEWKGVRAVNEIHRVLVIKIGKRGSIWEIQRYKYLDRMLEMIKRTCINIFIRARCVGECTNLIDLGCVDPRVGIDCLPDGKQSIHIPVHINLWSPHANS